MTIDRNKNVVIVLSNKASGRAACETRILQFCRDLISKTCEIFYLVWQVGRTKILFFLGTRAFENLNVQ